MRFFLSFCILVFTACSDDEKISKNQKQEDGAVQIEQEDAKIELNATNLPLPVGDGF